MACDWYLIANLTIQWGTSETSNKIWQSVTFPRTFETKSITIQGSGIGSGADIPVIINTNYTESGFEIGGAKASLAPVFWYAAGN